MAATSAIHFEIDSIDRHHFGIPPLFGHCDQTGVGQVHWLIGVFADQFADSGIVIAEVPRAYQETGCHCRQHRFSAAEEMRSFC